MGTRRRCGKCIPCLYSLAALGVDTKTTFVKGMIDMQSLVVHKLEERFDFVWGICIPNPFEILIWFQDLGFMCCFYVHVGRIDGEQSISS